MKFRMQPPEDLISRMLILEYMRELETKALHDKCNEHKQKKMFYRFYDEEEKEMLDINWEYVLFEATMFELESLMKHFLPEIEELDKKEKRVAERLQEEQKKILVPKNQILGPDGNPL